MIINQPIASNGKANELIENSPNPKSETYKELNVVQIFAHTITPMALCKYIIPAPTNHKSKSETILLLCKIHVATAPVTIDLTGQLVYFSKYTFIFFHASSLIPSSKVFIPKSKSHTPANNCQIFKASIQVIKLIKKKQSDPPVKHSKCK